MPRMTLFKSSDDKSMSALITGENEMRMWLAGISGQKYPIFKLFNFEFPFFPSIFMTILPFLKLQQKSTKIKFFVSNGTVTILCGAGCCTARRTSATLRD
jgi:hypothetical protein